MVTHSSLPWASGPHGMGGGLQGGGGGGGDYRELSAGLRDWGGAGDPWGGAGRAVTLKKASSKTSSGPEKPTTSSGWAPSREKRTPSTAVDTISSDTPISPSVFSPGAGKGQQDGRGPVPTWPLFLISLP